MRAPAAALTLLSLTACGRGDGVTPRAPHATTAPRGTAMLTAPDSRARILRSSHVAALRAARVEAAPGGRELRVTFQLLRAFKGAFDVAEGATFEARLTRHPPTEDYTSAPAGVWSLHDVAEGTRWMAFAEAPGEDRAAALVGDPRCRLVAPLDDALPDVELAWDVEHGGADGVGALALARGRAASLHPLAMEYLWHRFGAEAARDPARFERFLDLLEAPALRVQARTALLTELAGAVRPPERREALRARLAASLFRLLAMPEAAAHHDDLVAVHLPNALGLRGGPGVPPSELFRELPGAPGQARAALASYRGSRDVAALRAWLGAE